MAISSVRSLETVVVFSISLSSPAATAMAVPGPGELVHRWFLRYAARAWNTGFIIQKGNRNGGLEDD